MKGLTQKQQDVLDYVMETINLFSVPPTVREIAQKFNISVRGAYDFLNALEKKKKIMRGKGAREIYVIEKNCEHLVEEDERTKHIRKRNRAYRILGKKDVSLGECIICKNKEIERHHEDYNYPNRIIPLCQMHHKTLHIYKRALEKLGYVIEYKPKRNT